MEQAARSPTIRLRFTPGATAARPGAPTTFSLHLQPAGPPSLWRPIDGAPVLSRTVLGRALSAAATATALALAACTATYAAPPAAAGNLGLHEAVGTCCCVAATSAAF
jgi:hypothetical protein